MAFRTYDPIAGAQPIANNSTTQKHALGQIVRGTDPTLGDAEFIYLKGVASTAVGSVVTYDNSTYATTLCAVGGNIPRPIAIAMSACVANEFGWYQISGIAVAKKSSAISLAAGAAVGVLTTGLMAGTGSGKEISGAVVHAVASAKSTTLTVQVLISRPHKQGRVT